MIIDPQLLASLDLLSFFILISLPELWDLLCRFPIVACLFQTLLTFFVFIRAFIRVSVSILLDGFHRDGVGNANKSGLSIDCNSGNLLVLGLLLESDWGLFRMLLLAFGLLMARLIAMGALSGYFVCRSGFLVACRSAVALDVALPATAITYSFVSRIVSQQLLLVAPSFLGSDTTVRIVSCIERHLMVVSVPTSS